MGILRNVKDKVRVRERDSNLGRLIRKMICNLNVAVR